MNLKQKNGKKAAAFNDLPEGYLDQLRGRLTERLQREEGRKRQPSGLYAVAAAMALLLTTGLLWWLMPGQDTHTDLAQWQHSNDSLQTKKMMVTADTLHQRKTLSTKTLPTADSLDCMLDALALDEILLYLNETEEFEF